MHPHNGRQWSACGMNCYSNLPNVSDQLTLIFWIFMWRPCHITMTQRRWRWRIWRCFGFCIGLNFGVIECLVRYRVAQIFIIVNHFGSRFLRPAIIRWGKKQMEKNGLSLKKNCDKIINRLWLYIIWYGWMGSVSTPDGIAEASDRRARDTHDTPRPLTAQRHIWCSKCQRG